MAGRVPGMARVRSARATAIRPATNASRRMISRFATTLRPSVSWATRPSTNGVLAGPWMPVLERLCLRLLDGCGDLVGREGDPLGQGHGHEDAGAQPERPLRGHQAGRLGGVLHAKRERDSPLLRL